MMKSILLQMILMATFGSVSYTHLDVYKRQGHCMSNLKPFEPVIEQFKGLKNDIYAIYANCPLLDEKYKKNTAQFLDEFFAVIEDPKVWQKAFSYPCDPKGTGNVVIKGLKQD